MLLNYQGPAAARLHDAGLKNHGKIQIPTGLTAASPKSKAFSIKFFNSCKLLINGLLNGKNHSPDTAQDGHVRGLQPDASCKNANAFTVDISAREEFPGFSSPADAVKSGKQGFT